MAPYAIFWAIAVIVVAGIITISLNPVVNDFIDVLNPHITDGTASAQFVTYFNFAKAMLVALPMLVIFAVSAWSYVRAIERDGQTTSSPSSLLNGVIAAFIGVIFSIILFIAVGLPAEMMVTSFTDTTLSDGGGMYDVATPWNMGYADVSFWMNLIYVILLLPGIAGIIIMFLSAIRTQDYDVMGGSEYSGGYGQSSPQYITAEELAFNRGR